MEQTTLPTKTKIVGSLLIFYGIFFLFLVQVFSHSAKGYAKYGCFLFLTLCVLSFFFSYHIFKKKRHVGWGVFSLLLIDVILGVFVFFLFILGLISLLGFLSLENMEQLLLWPLLCILVYAYTGYTLQTIARKTNTENGWLAWIPVFNLYLLCKIARKPGWWTILLFIPLLVNVIIFIILWMRIAKIRNKPAWLGMLMILPIVNFVVAGILAFSNHSSQSATDIPSA